MADQSFNSNLHIVLAADNNYAQHLGVTLISLIINHRAPQRLVGHILDIGLAPENIAKLRALAAAYKIELNFYKLSKELLRDYPAVNHLSQAAYARLLLADLLPSEIEKVIYLDSDIVVLRDIAELYQQNLNGFSLGAVPDVMAQEIRRIYFYPGLTNYFNSGVLLINLNKWREKEVTLHSQQFIKDYYQYLIRADQDVLNCLFLKDWQTLAPIFNTDLKRLSHSTLPPTDTVILHYSDRIKPWSYRFGGKSKKYYFEYLAKTPWRDFQFKDQNLKNLFLRYLNIFRKTLKRLLLPLIPPSLIDHYRRLLWKTYKLKVPTK